MLKCIRFILSQFTMFAGDTLKVWLVLVMTVTTMATASEVDLTKMWRPFLISNNEGSNNNPANPNTNVKEKFDWPILEATEQLQRNSRAQFLKKNHACPRVIYPLTFATILESNVEYRPPTLFASRCSSERGKLGEICHVHNYTMWISKRPFNSNCWEPYAVEVPQCEAYENNDV